MSVLTNRTHISHKPTGTQQRSTFTTQHTHTHTHTGLIEKVCLAQWKYFHYIATIQINLRDTNIHKTYCRVQFKSNQDTFAYITNEGDFALLIFTFFSPHSSIGFDYKGNYNTLRVYIVHIWQYLIIQQDTGSDRHIGPCVKGKRPNRQADSWSV